MSKAQGLAELGTTAGDEAEHLSAPSADVKKHVFLERGHLEHMHCQPKAAAVYHSVLQRDMWLMPLDKLLQAFSSTDLKCRHAP